MNPVNATALYVSACRSVLQCDPRDPQSFADLYKLLPFFRQSLSCLVCGNLLQDPIAPTNSSCQHYVCKACKGQKMMMKPSCSWCKDYEQFEENKQLCILVECYRKLCEYIGESPLSQQIASAVGGCPDVLAMLNEGLSLTQREPEDSHISLSLNLSHSLAPSTSEDPCVALLEAPVEVREPPQSAPGVNGLHDCNGLSPVDELARSLSSPEGAAAEVRGSADGELKQSGFPDGLPTCEAVAAGELCADSIDICGFGDDVKHGGGGGALLLSVEEVLRTLEPDPEPDSVVPEDHSCILLPGPGVHGTHNGPSAEPPRQPSLPLDHGVFTPCPPQAPSGISCSAATPRVPRPNRKRSRSESDSEKVQPLPISSIIQGPPLAAPAPVAARQEPKVSTAQPVTLVPNGGPAKANKTLLVSSKGVKKNPDHVPKKACSKAKQGVPKAKDKTKDRNPNGTNNSNSNTLIPGSPTKVVYKKPQEKKGCKCGRATQNPSVLTCRGQRCPCYSNRKACLDCICRGCQNSYMANGEKKLEAFAVPEKALEQTRLTLGINVTSIAVRNPGTSAAGVLNVAAGSPVTAFLAASPHEDKGFDETLDMRFDC